MRNFGTVVLLALACIGCGEGRVEEVPQGSRELPEVRGGITAHDAFAIVYPVVLQVSSQPVMLLITSGPRIDAEGRSEGWEFVFHFPDRSAQGVYGFEPLDPERSEGGLRMIWRVSPRRHLRGEDAALPLDFIDSPDAARELSRMGVDWVAGDPDMTLAAKRLSSGEAVWAVESHGKEFAIPFAQRAR